MHRSVPLVVVTLWLGCAGAADASTIVLTASPTSAILGQTVTLTAKVTPTTASGLVTFYDGASVLGVARLSGGAAAFSTSLIPSGKRSLTALYQGDTSNTAGASPAVIETITSMGGTGFTSTNYPASTFAKDAVIADFNGDGRPDIAMVGTNGQNLIVLLGSGNGSFIAGPITTGPQSAQLRAGDFNADGKADVAEICGGQLCIYLGKGDGTFTALAPLSLVPFSPGPTPFASGIAVGDFNHDGKADIAIGFINATVSFPGVGVLLGNGDGTFQPLSSYSAGTNSNTVAVADFNGDGAADLCAADLLGTVAVLLGKGDGTFGPPRSYTAGSGANDVVTGDFNEDGKIDIAIATPGSPTGFHITMLLGNGDGTFSNGTNVNMPGSYTVLSLAAEDFNGDGHLDLALGSTMGTLHNGTLNILAGHGDGTFSLIATAPVGNTPIRTLAVDLNGDGRADVVTSNDYSNNITVLIATSSSALTIDTTSLTSAAFGVPYDVSLSASGGTPPYSNWKLVSGSLPAGITLNSAGVLTGTPTEYKASPYSFSVTVQDATAATSPAQSLSLTVAPPAPLISANGVKPAWGGGGQIQPGSWISIFGTNLAATTAVWNGDYPIILGGVTVYVNGRRGYLSYVSPTQINLEAPDDSTFGNVQLILVNDYGSTSATVFLTPGSLSIAVLGGSSFAAAAILTPDGSGAYGNGTYDIMGTAGAFSFPTRPVKPGEVLVLYGTGCGPTSPPVPAGIQFSGAAPTIEAGAATIGSKDATVLFSGVVSPGLCQFNVVVPAVSAGNQTLSISSAGGAESGPYVAVAASSVKY